MKQILVLGAGQSAPYLIHYLLKESKKKNWFVTVGDIDLRLARKSINNHPNGDAIRFNVNDAEMRNAQIARVDVVINFLPPTFQYLIALSCIANGKHMITASYQDERMRDIDQDAHRKGILLLNEMGLDPGIDLMSAMAIIQKVRDEGGKITSFKSYGSGLPAKKSVSNPLGYAITWNARNVVMAGDVGAQYLYKNQIKILPHHEVFQRTWTVDLNGVGPMEAYPNRDSLQYRSIFGVDHAHTMIRGTLRYPGWSETWLQIVRLGLPNEVMHIPDICNYSYRDLVNMFLPLYAPGSDLEHRLANFLNINPTGKIMENLRWLGLLSDEKIKCNGDTASAVMIDLLKKKLKLPAKGKDMVAIVHEMEAEYKDKKRAPEKIVSTLVKYGESGGFTAIAKTVGLPAAIATKLLLAGEIPIIGCQRPTHPVIYTKVLKELEEQRFTFVKKTEPIKASD